MADGVTGGPDLPHTPTWVTAVVITMMMILAGIIEFIIHKFTQWFQNPRWSWLSFLDLEEPLEKIKTEFMLMGFMSILINWFATPMSNICIGGKAGHIILPCNSADGEAAGRDHCLEKGKVALTSAKSLHQLDTFMLVLPVVHVIYSLVAMALARFRMKSWKKWESTARLEEEQQSTTGNTAVAQELQPNGPETWIMVFFRQFYQPMREGDYRIMRLHFIQTTTNDDFYEYITACFKKDTKAFISISLPLRGVTILMVLLNIHGMGTLFWISFVPLGILLAVGAKLIKVYVEMEFNGTGPSFWFNQPGIIRFLIRLALFENAFLMAHFLWAMGTSGLKNCYYKNLVLGITGAVLGVALQIFCGWVTFPLYAIVTKMATVMVVENRDANWDEESLPYYTDEHGLLERNAVRMTIWQSVSRFLKKLLSGWPQKLAPIRQTELMRHSRQKTNGNVHT